jgi:anti-sigma B factor antagonist
MNPTQIMIALTDTTVYLKPLGRANFQVSVSFKSAVAELHSRGFCRLILELSECESMDSTFLGVLSAWATQLQSSDGPKNIPPIELRNPSVRIVSLLDDLGIKPQFTITEAEPIQLQYTAAPASAVSHEVLSQTSLDAHQALMAIHPSNVPKFKNVVDFLKEDLAQLRAPRGEV